MADEPLVCARCGREIRDFKEYEVSSAEGYTAPRPDLLASRGTE